MRYIDAYAIQGFMSLFILAMAVGSQAQQHESLFVDVAAYDPLPSPDGRHVAYLLSGRRPFGGSGGMGRSNLRSEIVFSKADGTYSKASRSEGFLGQWLPDSSALVSFRDGRFALVGPDKTGPSESMPNPSVVLAPPAERVAYLAAKKTFVWVEHHERTTLLQTPAGPIATFNGLLALSAVISSSPDGRYLAIGGQGPFLYEDHNLRIFNLESGTWTDLGPLTIHPDPDWDYTKPSWSPWFSNSKELAFFSGDILCVMTPDGLKRRELLHVKSAGLATVSPGGGSIAYVTFTARDWRRGSGHMFWGGSTLWKINANGGAPTAITAPSENETLALRWLSESTLIFDRVGEGLFNADGRIWKVSTENQ